MTQDTTTTQNTRHFSARSLKSLEQVHPDLVACANIALQTSPCDFTIIQGKRTQKEQEKLVKSGASKTTKSYHLIQPDGFAHAIDLYPFYDGKLHGADKHQTTAERIRNAECWRQIAKAFKEAAAELRIKITWGGDWKGAWDMPHFQYEGRV